KTDGVKTLTSFRRDGTPTVFSAWSTVFRIDVNPNPWVPDTYVINHDGNWGSVLQAFDGDVTKLGRFERDSRSFPFRVVKSRPEVLVIGAAGGHELLASLYFDVGHVT